MSQPRTYLFTFAAWTLVLMALVGAANAVVDPFGLFEWVTVPGVNANKAGQHGHDRLVKAYAIRRRQPDVLLLGTSRVQYGLDPGDPALAVVGRRPYNAGLLGANVYLMLRYLQHAHRASPLNAAVVGLDALAFDDAGADATRDFSEARMLANEAGTPQRGWAPEDAAMVLLSFDALRLSQRTLRQQATLITDLTAGGQRAPAALARFFAEGASTRANFVASERAYFADYGRARLPVAGQPSRSMQHLEAMLAFAHDEHIRLELYLTPEHVRLHEVARQAGRQEAVDSWRLQVAERVHRAAQAPGAPAIRLWNMAGLDARTCEPVPPAAAGHAATGWFWEATHARDRLGHLILARMLLAAPGAEAEAVGQLAAPAALGEQLDLFHRELSAWETRHPEDVLEIAASRDRMGQAR